MKLATQRLLQIRTNVETIGDETTDLADVFVSARDRLRHLEY